MGKCPSCNAWNTLVEEVVAPTGGGNLASRSLRPPSKPQKITAIQSENMPRMTTEMGEFNRVLGGGIVPGSLILIGGDPGIGKSTLLLQISAQLAEKKLSVLYISGEESTQQTKLRADRLGITAESLYVLAETNLFDISEQIKDVQPAVVIIDSIQTM